MSGFFSAQNPVQPTSPDLHQNMSRSPPSPCTGVHQKGCDLGGVEGVTPPNIHSSIQWPTPKQPKVSLLRLQPLTLHLLLHLLRLPWQFLQPSHLLLRRRVAPSPSRASSSPVVWFSGEDTDFVAIHLPSAHPSASASIQRLLVSPVLPSDPWVHPEIPATAVPDQASSNICICTELTKVPHLGDVIIPRISNT